MKKVQNVLIKGTKDGLTLHLDDQCSFADLKKEMTQKLTEDSIVNEDTPLISVRVQIGNRYLTDDQKEEIRQLVRQKKNLIVESIDSNVITRHEANAIKAEDEIVSVAKIIRSGQVLEVPGDLLLIGDVNPGGMVAAGGNIFIMGALRGIAHAGVNGDSKCIIAASIMAPTQLKICQYINRAPDHTGKDEEREMECAYIDHNDQIVIDRLQALMHLRPNLTRLEGGF